MSKGVRNFLIICGGIVGVGVILCIIGFILGGSFSEARENGSWFNIGGAGNVVSREYKASPYTEIEVDNNFNDIQLVESDQYRVELVYNEKYTRPTAEVKNGVLTVKDHKRNRNFFNFNLFGAFDEKDTSIIIYYPSNAKFDDVKLTSDLGDIDIEGLETKNLQINSSAGDIAMKNVTADTLNAESDMGSVEGIDIKTESAELDLSAGDLDLTGTLKGTTKVETDMGDCTINTDLSMDKYDIKVSVDLGDCIVDGADMGSHYEKDGGKSNAIKVNASAGDVNLNF